MKPRLGALLTHPVQYYSPWLRELAKASDLTVYYAHRQTAEGQAKAGFSTAFDWDVPLLDGYEWRWLNNISKNPGLTTFGGCDTPEIGNIVREARLDALIMFGWNRKCFVQGAAAALRTKTPLLIRLDSQLSPRRSLWKRLLKYPFYSVILPRLAHYLSPGSRTDDYLRHYHVPENRIHRLAHMIDTERFSQGAQAAREAGADKSMRAQFNAADKDFVLLFVGKLIPRKRIDLVLEALRLMKTRSPEAFARTRVWLLGDGPLRSAFEAFVKTHDLPVDFIGFINQSRLPSVYPAADCLILASSDDTWGLVVNEAFACGVPAIVADGVGCAPELIEEGVTGWVLKSDNPADLADIIATASVKARSLARDRIDVISRQGSYGPGVTRMLEIVERGSAQSAGNVA